MFALLDRILGGITMYRLVLYELLVLCVVAGLFKMFGFISGSPLFFLASVVFFLLMCWAGNLLFSATFRAPANVESVYISALILALIIAPMSSWRDVEFFTFAGWASLLSMASKYILAARRKHFFNPVALAIAVTGLTLNEYATWWVGTLYLLPFVTVGGFLIVRKIQRFDLVLSFLVAAFVMMGLSSVSDGFAGVLTTTGGMLTNTAIIFFATVMLTEPLTTPPRRRDRIAYGVFVGLLYPPFIHVGSLYSTPELVLLAGNVLAYLLSPKAKLLLTLRQKMQLTHDTVDFVFSADRRLPFHPGQYLEWTLPHPSPDGRGNRRTFTIASAPTEKEVHLGAKFYESSSSFKRRLLALQPGDVIGAGQLAGDFILPRNPARKLAFLAGGIGITPFRSMVQFLLDTGENRSIVLLYCNRTEQDIAYKEFFDSSAPKLGMKVVHTVTDERSPSPSWQGRTGRIDAAMIREEIPDYLERMFYLSGTHAMVQSFHKLLRDLGIPRASIVQDYFPGFA